MPMKKPRLHLLEYINTQSLSVYQVIMLMIIFTMLIIAFNNSEK
ncbi:putative holin-like toxin [Lactococcus lactis]